MAQICREVQERIVERRREAHRRCREVSRTIIETVCSWMPWPLSELCKYVTRVVTEIVCAIVWIVVTIVSWVTRLVCEILVIFDWIIDHLAGFLEWLGNRFLTFPEWTLCRLGVGTGKKKYRICPMVIAGKDGKPVISLKEIEAQIEKAARVFEQCNIDVIASEIKVIEGRSHLANVSGCNASGYFSADRVELGNLSCCEGLINSLRCLRLPSGLLWPRHVLKAIWVTSIANGKAGCYMPPDSFVLVAANYSLDTLAHEMGHAGDLRHDKNDNTNLMFTPNRTDSKLRKTQCCVVRTSRFVTFL